MRAFILKEPGGIPEMGYVDEPGGEVIDVRLAGCNPVDIMLASGQMGDPRTPSVVGREGVGVGPGGDRVYFNGPPEPYGSWAERCPVPADGYFPVPDEVDDKTAVALGIAGLAAWLPLTRHTTVGPGTNLLVLGATGTVGAVAIQAAAVLGVDRVVAAGRDPDVLAGLPGLGASSTVRIGQGDDRAALAAEAGDGFDVVIDAVYGDPFLAALDCTATGATLVTVGLGAQGSAEVSFRSLQGRTHVGHGNEAMPLETRRAGYAELMDHAARGRFRLRTRTVPLSEAGVAWRAQAEGPHEKLAVAP